MADFQFNYSLKKDQSNIKTLTNCFLKKTQKTPPKEIKIAERLKREYLIEKYGGQ